MFIAKLDIIANPVLSRGLVNNGFPLLARGLVNYWLEKGERALSMADYPTTEDYTKHLRTLSIDQLIDIAHHIDKEKYPDRYNIVLRSIREKDKEPRQVSLSSPIKITKWQSFLWHASAWLFLTFLIYWKWGNITSEQSYLYYLYPFFSAYIIAGYSFQAWYLTIFRMAVGRPKFFFTLFVGIFILILTIIMAGKGYGGVKLFLIFFMFSMAHVGLVVALYRMATLKNMN